MVRTMRPEIHETAFIAKSAVVVGDVKIGRNCGVYPNAVIRGDKNSITIQDGSNIQDNCVIHTDQDHIVKIGRDVSVGHGAIIHGAIIEDKCIIGMNATVLNGAKIGRGSFVGANALVTENSVIPENSLVLGVPGRVVKTDKKLMLIAEKNADEYKQLSKEHLQGKHEQG